MDFRPLIFSTAIACSAAAIAAPAAVDPLFTGKVVRTFAGDTGSDVATPIPAGSFPVKVLQESSDGSRYQVQTANGDVWVPKMDVKASQTGINVTDMCSTVVARAPIGAARNANDACRPK